MSSVAKQLIALSCAQSVGECRRFADLARIMGVPVEDVGIEPGDALLSDFLGKGPQGSSVPAMHFATLRDLYESQKPHHGLKWLTDGRFPEILVYGQLASPTKSDFLAVLTEGAIAGLRTSDDNAHRFRFSPKSKDMCAQLAGQSITASQMGSVSWFDVQAGASSVEVIMEANEHPVFVRWKTSSCEVFLLAGAMPDLNKGVEGKSGLESEAILLIPPLIFLRQSFGDYCWHNPRSTARLIIDDPYIAKRYGFLDMAALSDSMQRLRYGTSIAFIPWNSWRTSRRKASEVLGGNANLTLCVHGCDHTNREFGSGSRELLYAKARLGMQRMVTQHQRAGVPFEDVMVFPQGIFSKAAIPALRSANYLATVNSTCLPSDGAPDDLKVSDFLWPAVTRFNGFPLFHRHYPRSIFDFAIDLFLGKPAIIVEHHAYFRDQCKAINQFVSELQEVDPGLSWPDLTTQFKSTHLRRMQDGRVPEIRFFTRRFQFECNESTSDRCLLSKHEPDASIIESVLVNGKTAPMGFDGGLIWFEVEARPGELNYVEILDRAAPTPTIRTFGAAHNARVLLRRGLSEFRDNTLSRHQGMLKVAQRLAKTAKATGDA